MKAVSQSTRGSGGAASLYSDTRAHAVGDALTIVVAENTSAASSTSTKISQDDTVNALNGTGLFHGLLGRLALSATNSRSGNGSGTTTRSGTLTTTLSVLVKEVLPNGNLRIEGSRTIGINRETQKVIFSGVVRPEDIGQDNTIQSNLIAGVEIHYDGKGINADTNRPGILQRIFRFLF